MILDFGFWILDFWGKPARKFSFITLVLFLGTSCIPNLEPADCAEAKDSVKHFYSYHFGSDMRPSADNLKQREKYLTPELTRELAGQTENPVDYFTATDDYPKAFRVGACRVSEPGKKAEIQILLFWKTETRSEQREIQVETVKENDTWLIGRVSSK